MMGNHLYSILELCFCELCRLASLFSYTCVSLFVGCMAWMDQVECYLDGQLMRLQFIYHPSSSPCM